MAKDQPVARCGVEGGTQLCYRGKRGEKGGYARYRGKLRLEDGEGAENGAISAPSRTKDAIGREIALTEEGLPDTSKHQLNLTGPS